MMRSLSSLRLMAKAKSYTPPESVATGKGNWTRTYYYKDRHAEAPRPDPAIFRRHGVIQIDHCTIGIFLLDGRLLFEIEPSQKPFYKGRRGATR
jgi:hypothetical protein